MNDKQDRFADTRFTKLTRLTEKDWQWIKDNKGKKSAAGFLEQIIKEARKAKLF